MGLKCYIVFVMAQDGSPPKFYRLYQRYKPTLEELQALGVTYQRRADVHIERISRKLFDVLEGERLQ